MLLLLNLRFINAMIIRRNSLSDCNCRVVRSAGRRRDQGSFEQLPGEAEERTEGTAAGHSLSLIGFAMFAQALFYSQASMRGVQCWE